MMRASDKLQRFERFLKIDLYPVTCMELSNGRSDEDVLEGLIEGGAKIVQLRDKISSSRALFKKAEHFRKRTRDAGMLLIINDHVDIALAVDADGVHLGQNDFPHAKARELLPGQLIGASTHNIKEAVQAEKDGCDYINIGPLFATQTKNNVHKAIGVEMIGKISSRVNLPFTVMGGIKLENLQIVLSQNARKIAMVTEITQAQNIAEKVRLLRKKMLRNN